MNPVAVPDNLCTEFTAKTIYVEPEDRFVVALVTSYNVQTPKEALAAAIELTRDEGSEGTHWYIFDRETGIGEMYEQSMATDIDEENDVIA